MGIDSIETNYFLCVCAAFHSREPLMLKYNLCAGRQWGEIEEKIAFFFFIYVRFLDAIDLVNSSGVYRSFLSIITCDWPDF